MKRVWDEEAQRMRDAPSGRHGWTATLYAEPDEDDVCGGDRSVSASVDIDAL